MKDGDKNKACEIDPFKNWRTFEVKWGPVVLGEDITAGTMDSSNIKVGKIDASGWRMPNEEQ